MISDYVSEGKSVKIFNLEVLDNLQKFHYIFNPVTVSVFSDCHLQKKTDVQQLQHQKKVCRMNFTSYNCFNLFWQTNLKHKTCR